VTKEEWIAAALAKAPAPSPETILDIRRIAADHVRQNTSSES
jgi:hypothetical protein